VVNSSTGTVQLDEQPTTLFTNLSEAQKQDKIKELKSFEEGLRMDIRDPAGISHKILFSKTKDIILEWANTMKQLHYLGDYEQPINTISSYIKSKIGKVSTDLDSKDISYRYVDQVLPDEFKKITSPKKDVEKLPLNTSARELTSEEQFVLDSIVSLRSVFMGMVSITGVMIRHLQNPDISAEMQKYFDDYSKIAALREPMEFMMGEGSILHQIDDEQNIRESATILQKAIAKLMSATLSYRQMAHFFGVSPRQNQRIRNRLDEWPAKDAKTVIRKNILSYCCQNCGMNVITGKVYNKNGNEIDQVKLNNKFYNIPEQYKNSPLSPIQIAIDIAENKQKENSNDQNQTP
jgi:hypothetical protein